jgi:hypothetical protein
MTRRRKLLSLVAALLLTLLALGSAKSQTRPEPETRFGEQLTAAQEQIAALRQAFVEKSRTSVCFVLIAHGKPLHAGSLGVDQGEESIDFPTGGLLKVWLPEADGHCGPPKPIVCHDSLGSTYSLGAKITESGMTYRCGGSGWEPEP